MNSKGPVMTDGVSLGGKVALITGAAGAIGTETAVLMAKRGAKIVAVDRPATDFGPLRKRLDVEIVAIEADVSNEDSVRSYVDKTMRAHGRIDIFFNNAGVEGMVMPIHDYPLEEFRRIFAVNVDGVFLGLKYVLPVMLDQGSGSVINSSSVGGLCGTRGMVGYNSSKHAVIGLTRVAAVEVAAKGVRVNCINPGPIRSRMMVSLDAGRGSTEEARGKRVPAGRYGRPEEVAGLVAFLASDDATYVNGSFHTVDGGLDATA
jgi:NAD(P)-dependent dehydrogenase (short-subunit alcohol dehydrogenase family)